jgi:hypothetical protein
MKRPALFCVPLFNCVPTSGQKTAKNFEAVKTKEKK